MIKNRFQGQKVQVVCYSLEPWVTETCIHSAVTHQNLGSDMLGCYRKYGSLSSFLSRAVPLILNGHITELYMKHSSSINIVWYWPQV